MVKATEEDGLEDLLNSEEGLVWVGTPKGRVLYSNEAFRRFVRCQLPATASTNAASWTDWLASSQPGAMVDVQAAMESGRKAELVVPTHRLPSGKQVALQVSLTPLAEGSSTGEGILGSAKLLQAPPAAPPAFSPFSTGKAASAGAGCEDDSAWASLGVSLRNGTEPCCIMEALTHAPHAPPYNLGAGPQAPAHRRSSAGCGCGLPSRLSSGTLGALTEGLNANGAELAAVGLASMAVLTPISPSDSSMSLTACGGPSGHDDGSGDAGGGEEPVPPATAAGVSAGADGAQAGVGLGRRKPSGTALAAAATAAAAAAPIRLVSCNPALEQLLGYTQQQLQQGGVELLLPPGTAAAEHVGPYPASHVSAAGAWTPAVLVSALTAGASAPRELLMDCRHASGRVLRLGVRVHPVGAAGEQLQSEQGQTQQARGWRHAHGGTEAAKRSHGGGEQGMPAAAGSSSSYCSSCSGQGPGGRAGGEAAEGGGQGSNERKDRYARGCNDRARQEDSTASSDGTSSRGSAMVSAKSSCADVTALDPGNVSSKREGCIGINSDSGGGVTTAAGESASEAAAAATGIATDSRCGRSDGSGGGITHGSSRACDANSGLVHLQDQQQQQRQQQNKQQGTWGLPQHSSAPQQQAAPRPQRFMLSFVQRQELNSTAQGGGIASGTPQLAPGPLFGPGCPVGSAPAHPSCQTVAPGTASTPPTAGGVARPAVGASPSGLQVEPLGAGWFGAGSRGHGDALLLPAPCSLRDMALDAVREGIVIADPSSPDSPLVYTNTAFLTMTGYSKEEVLGRNCRFLQGPDTDPRAVQAIRDAITRRADVTVTLLNYTKGGVPFWNELRLTPVTDPGSGRLLAYIGVQNDVTELVARKESEARMRDAKEAAESATEAKSQFVANMSHEIRTPLNGMIATAQLLLASVLTPEQRELTETILESGSALLGILGDILDFSKIDHGSLELQRQPMCLRQATEACLELVAAEAAKKGLALAYLADDAALGRALLGDPVRVRQVLANLLSNAVKFTERGEVVVHVTVEPAATCRNPLALAAEPATPCAPADTPSTPAPATPTCSGASAADNESDQDQQQQQAAADEACRDDGEGGGEVVHFAVADTGIGIGAESARKLFQHFRQGSETMSRRYGGTGLGLAISKRLAQLMCGDIWVESELGKGSTFHFTLKAEWALGPWSPPTSSAASPADSVNCTPRSSTEVLHPGVGAAVVEGIMGGGTWAGSSSVLPPPPPPAVPVPVPMPPGIARSSTSSTSSGSTARTVRELRKSPWLPDGTPMSEGDCGASGSGSGSASAAFVGSPLGGVSGLASPLAADCLAAAAGAQPGSASTSVTGYVTSGGGRPSSSSGRGVGGAAAEAEAHESALVALHGRTVLVDVSHAALSRQVWNSCRQLGLAAVQARACGGPAGAAAAAAVAAAAAAAEALTVQGTADGCAAAEPGAPPSADAPMNQLQQQQQQQQYDILVVSMDRLVPAFKAGWKGRPVVALGDREQLPPTLQPLVVVTVLPVRHSRLCNALVKSTALLKWNGNSAPKLGNTPIPSESIQMLKSWRLKKGPAYDADAFNRRTSLDNSVLERAAMARGAAAGAAGRGGAGGPAPRAPAQAPMSIPENAEFAAGPEERLPPSLLAQQQQLLQQQAATSAVTPPPASVPAPAPSPSTTPGASPSTGGSSAAAAAAASLLPQQLRILIAEDNKVNQKVVLKVLQQILRGCQPPDVVENGLQVLQALQKKTYDLILMDIHMPEMDGLEASKRIQETYKPEERPRIIALSADTVQTLHDRCREAGIEAFLVKPFRIEDLARVMRTHNRVQRREGDAAPGRPSNGGLAA